jgi:hypothetical protein
MGEIVNLRHVRKAKARDEKQKAAEVNRTVHGTPAHLRKLGKAKTAKFLRDLDAHKKD